MKGQISLETLIVLAAMAGILVLFAERYAEIEDMVTEFLLKSREAHARSILEDIARNCEGISVEISFPYSVQVECKSGKAYIGGDGIDLTCSESINGRKFRIKSCHLTQIS